MTSSIPIPFPLGVPLWWATGPHEATWVQCPECCGTKVIEVVLGTGERFSLDCRCCQSGYEPPRGVIKQHSYRYKPVQFIPRRVTVYGDDFSYSESPPEATCYSSVDYKHLFATEAECQVECDRKNAECEANQAEQLIQARKRSRQDLAWSAHYWGSHVKRLEKELEIARARLQRIKANKKEQAA